LAFIRTSWANAGGVMAASAKAQTGDLRSPVGFFARMSPPMFEIFDSKLPDSAVIGVPASSCARRLAQ
jgi:hypothetical protein